MAASESYRGACLGVLGELRELGFIGVGDEWWMRQLIGSEQDTYTDLASNFAAAACFTGFAVEAASRGKSMDQFSWSLAARFALLNAGLRPTEVESELSRLVEAARTDMASNNCRNEAAAFTEEMNIAARLWKLAN